MILLGIETSCDETSAAIVEDGTRVLSSIVANQADLHAKWGGVVPEVASRLHVERVLPVITEAMEAAAVGSASVQAIAVTNRPGLIGALVVGVACAKALAFAWRVPLLGVHHIVGHLYAPMLSEPTFEFPFLCLVVSGGHTELILASGHGSFCTLGRTRDDAAGECFDKCARLLGLPYPGGPEMERVARDGDPGAVAFPRAWLGDSLDFSFSGLKTAVARFIETDGGRTPTADVAASLQAAIVEVLVNKALLAAERTGVCRVALGGGVAANKTLAREFADACLRKGLRYVVPPVELCTDNAAMIAAAAHHRATAGEDDGLAIDTVASDYLPLCPSVAAGRSK